MSGPRSRVHTTRVYWHEVDGFLVGSNLSPEDMAGWSERRRLATLRRMLRDTPEPKAGPGGVVRFWRWRRRLACHGSVWCCQYIDAPNCNGSLDRHRVALRARRKGVGKGLAVMPPLTDDELLARYVTRCTGQPYTDRCQRMTDRGTR